jgi:TRAP-type C4-dicarboxylate transport system substrate-binding protein
MHEMRTLVAVAAILMLGGCGSNVDRLGQPADTTVTLSALSAQGIDEVSKYGTEVEQLSGGRMRLEIEAATDRGPGTEPLVVNTVRAGDADVGFAGTRVWSGLGSHAFDALQAPLLIDSYPLQERVLTSDITDDMTSDLDVDGVVGLGVIPGPLRYIMGRAGPMRRPEDFAGATIGISEAAITRRAVAALSGSVVPIGPTIPVGGLDAVEAHMGAYVGNGYQRSFPFVTDNLPISARSISVFMNRARFDALTEEQRSWLARAARTATPEVVDGLVKLDAEWLGRACRTGARLEPASAADRAALESGLRSVYDELRSDRLAAVAFDSIAALKGADGPARLACRDEASASLSPAPASTPVDGAWTTCPTVDDILAAGGDPGEARENAGCITITLHGGIFQASGPAAGDAGPGSYAVDGDQLTIDRANGERFKFTFSLYRDTMILTLPNDPNGVSPAPMRALPLTRDGR